MLAIKVSDVLERASFYLNDVNRAFFDNDVLLPPFMAALDDLKEQLFDHNVQITNSVSDAISIAIGVTDIGGPTGPAMPVNFMAPIQLWDRQDGTTNDYILVKRVRFLPKSDDTELSQISCWTYSEQIIKFLPCNQARQIKLDYVGDNIGILEHVDDQINLFNAKSFLSYRTAALAAEFLGESPTRAGNLNTNADRAMDSLLSIDIKSQQSMPVRRRPFRAGYKRYGNYGFWGT